MPDYGPDLAAIHDAGHSDAARLGARRLLAELERDGIESGVIVDLGCGSGVSSRVLADAGYDVLGVDPSPAMLELAKERAPTALFKLGSAHDAELPRCVAVAALGEPLNYVLEADSASDAASGLGPVFARIRQALLPGGVFAFDIAGPDRGAPRQAVRSWREDEGWAVLVEATQTGRLLRRRIVSFREHGGWRRAEEIHLQRLYPEAEVLEALGEAGYRARGVIGWDGRRERPGHSAFIARRGAA